MRFAKTLPTAFLTGIKTRKRKREKREKKRIFSLLIFMLVWPSSFSLYGNGRPPHPAGWCRYAPQPAPLSVGERFIFFLDKNEHSVLHSFFFFLIFIKEKEREREKEKRKEGGKKKNKKIFRRENLAGRISYSKLLFILIRIFFLTDKRKTIF